MKDTASGSDNANAESGQTIVYVSAEHTQVVLDFLATLDSEENDVSGYLNAGELIANSGALKKVTRYSTDTGCGLYVTGILIPDFTCTDSDTGVS